MPKLHPRKLLIALAYRWPLLRHCACNVCGGSVGGFLPYRSGSKSSPAAMRALSVVGSNLDQFECPRCGAHDRERHLLLYLRASGLWDRVADLDILHFAPERRLSRLMVRLNPRRLVRCDLYPQEPGVVRVDMHDIPYPAESFDLVIANHVLEHVDDDRLAVAEIARVLRPGGHAILQTPFSPMLHHTFADPGISSEASRLQLYGQEDHVRLFGRDIFERIAQAGGLRSLVADHSRLLGGVDSSRFGLNPEEPFFLFQKPA